MSWTDKTSLEQFKKLRDRFDIKIFVETGTFKGIGAEVHANNFDVVLTAEAVPEYYWEAKKRLFNYNNVFPVLQSSPDFLRNIKSFLKNNGTIFFYLDAHFYDPALSPEDRWVVLKELRALEGFGNCVIAIHDFKCNGLGHLIYDGQPLNFEFVREAISKINPNFNYYFNTLDTCDILSKERVAAGEIPNLKLDAVSDDNLTFAWSNPVKTYRGILYATPEPLELSEFQLVTYNEI